ncbi:MAG: peptidoglycan editing factor PgeF [Neisseria sp.]|nr:peptidoglycan editing factor PgeF [Neisseria sp.]
MFYRADWDAPSTVHTLLTTRIGGVSTGAYASLNLGLHVGDDAAHVAENRRRVQELVPVPLVYLNQVHGTEVIDAANALHQTPTADAAVERAGKAACVIMTADCLPVLLCDARGTVVAAAHCGWRSLAGGILHRTIAAMQCPPQEISAFLGTAISPDAFEVGQDVYDVFTGSLPTAADCFAPLTDGKYLADIYALARLTLQQADVTRVFGGEGCTVLERERFFSYRRDHTTGRMAAVIWLEKP